MDDVMCLSISYTPQCIVERMLENRPGHWSYQEPSAILQKKVFVYLSIEHLASKVKRDWQRIRWSIMYNQQSINTLLIHAGYYLLEKALQNTEET